MAWTSRWINDPPVSPAALPGDLAATSPAVRPQTPILGVA